MDKHKRILVVDDDDQIANMYISYLNIKGFTTQRVNNGEDALAVTLVFKPDLIILDVMMPKISGFEVLDILRNTAKTKHIPVLMLPALGGKEDREKVNGIESVDYFVKTEVDLETIIKKIEEKLSKT